LDKSTALVILFEDRDQDDAGRVDLGMQRLGQRVMAGHGVLLRLVRAER
jgi:hypothetical protein